jgi:restriction system protein
MVECSVCGTPIDDEVSNTAAEERKPCPKCGATSRTILIRVADTLNVSLEGLAATVKESANILLQTVIVPEEKTAEGLIIQAVAFPWFDIVELLAKDPSIAYQLSDRQWEEIVAGAYKRAKFDEVILTPRSGDYGRDVIAIKKGLGTVRIIDQVKAYKPDHLVTANDVRALLGVLHGDGASKGFLTTTSDFAPKLKVDPLISPFIPSRLELINGRMLLNRLRELKKK